MIICKNCGEELRRSRYNNDWIHTGSCTDVCAIKKYAEPVEEVK